MITTIEPKIDLYGFHLTRHQYAVYVEYLEMCRKANEVQIPFPLKIAAFGATAGNDGMVEK